MTAFVHIPYGWYIYPHKGSIKCVNVMCSTMINVGDLAVTLSHPNWGCKDCGENHSGKAWPTFRPLEVENMNMVPSPEYDKSYPVTAWSDTLYWVITDAPANCHVKNQKIESCGNAPILVGSVAVRFDNSSNPYEDKEDVFWCAACTVQIQKSAKVPEELIAKVWVNSLIPKPTIGTPKVINLTSFGYKNGEPQSNATSKTFDIRKTVRNPWSCKDLRKLTGKAPEIQAFVSKCPKFSSAVSNILIYCRAGWDVNIGCQGGKHRAVAVAEMVAARLTETGVPFNLVHRDLVSK